MDNSNDEDSDSTTYRKRKSILRSSSSSHKKRKTRFDPNADDIFTRKGSSNLQNLFENNLHCDVVVKTESAEINCHLTILVSCSDYFSAMFSHEMRESKERIVSITNFSDQTVKDVIRYCYSYPTTINQNNCEEMLEASMYFQIECLKQRLVEYLSKHFHHSVYFKFLDIATKYGLDRLTEKFTETLFSNFLQISQDDFNQLSIERLSNYLKDDRIKAYKEDCVVEVVLEYIKENEGMVLKNDDKQADLFRCIRYSQLNSQYFYTFTNHPIVKNISETNPKVKKIFSEVFEMFCAGITNFKRGKNFRVKPRNCNRRVELLALVGGQQPASWVADIEFIKDGKRMGRSAFMEKITSRHKSLHTFAATAHDQSIVLCGGHYPSYVVKDLHSSLRSTSAVSMLDCSTFIWSELPEMEFARERHTLVSCCGSLYAAGGLQVEIERPRKPIVLGSIEKYDLGRYRWTQMAPMPQRCYAHCSVVWRNKIYLFGGVSVDSNSGRPKKNILNIIQIYDPLLNKWSTSELGMELARLCCALHRHCVYLLSNCYPCIFKYDLKKQTFEVFVELGKIIKFASMEVLDGDLHVMGGKDENGILLDKDILVGMATRTVKESRRCNQYKRSNSVCVKVRMRERLVKEKVERLNRSEVIHVLESDEEEFVAEVLLEDDDDDFVNDDFDDGLGFNIWQ